LGGGDSQDYIEGNLGSDIAVGDCASILFYPNYFIDSVTSTSTDVGKPDVLKMGGGDDIAIAGDGGDEIYGDTGRDILLGDSGEISFYDAKLPRDGEDPTGYFWNVPHLIETISCAEGGGDRIYAGDGRDVVVGGGGEEDFLYGGEGSDIVLGDHGVIEFDWFDVAAPNLLGLQRIETLICAEDEAGGENYIEGNDGDDILLGGGDSQDYIEGNLGSDIAVGDCASILFYPNYFIDSVTSTSTDVGKPDVLKMGGGDDIAIAGDGGDEIYGDTGRDILLGDSGEISFYDAKLPRDGEDPTGYFWNVPHLIETISCADGGGDRVYAGDGAVDYIIGGAFNDTVEGNGGPDLVFGDHASIELYESEPYKLRYAKTINANCTGGEDTIRLGDGNDVAFGGAFGDYIEGNIGQDIILGDFGLYDAEKQFLPNQYFEPIIAYPSYAGPDVIQGGDGDDLLMGQEYDDVIEGGGGSDDILGGHSKIFGSDTNDTLRGDDDDDVILGENGNILREVLGNVTDFPWIAHVWKTYPSPFNSEVIRDWRRYDDIDLVEGDDMIYGGSGNDILVGQRGVDEIHGGEGEDEIYGNLGGDYLYGDGGNDIVLGDTGYVIRRYSGSEPLLTSKGLWHKDIVLEELGAITGIERISTQVNVERLRAESIAASSLLFVANAYNDAGVKHLDSSNIWVTDLITFDLESAHDDHLYGGEDDDVLIGQRGDDHIFTGEGNDLAIGDGGTNRITATLDLPRIYQIYRSLPNNVTMANGYAPMSPQFGFAFTSDFDLYPTPHRFIDSQSSILDELISFDDASTETNVVRDILGISAISTDSGYCMQPMFRVIPGYESKTSMLSGNDHIVSEGGQDILVGDDIRGFSALDLTEFKAIQDTRQVIDDLITDLGVSLSTLGYDTQHYLRLIRNMPSLVEYNISVGCDNISTSENTTALVTGDTLTVMGRTFLGSYLTSPSEQVPQFLERIRDVQLSLVNLHFALYETHLDLLVRTQVDASEDFKVGQDPSHSLKLADDIISSNGNGDIIVGDSTVFYAQIDSAAEGFEFEVLKQKLPLKAIMDRRQEELDAHVEIDLAPSEPLANSEQRQLAFADVPFYISVGNDEIGLQDNGVICAGDFASLGITYSEEGSSRDTRSLSKYTESIGILRVKPSVSSFLPGLDVYDISFFNGRYDSETKKKVAPTYHGDLFFAQSVNNIVFGDFLSAATYGFGDGSVVRDGKVDFYGIYENAEWAQFFAKDTIESLDPASPPYWIGQKGNDDVIGDVQKGKTDPLVEEGMQQFFGGQQFATQIRSDLSLYTTKPYAISDDVSLRAVCNADDPGFSYVPSHTLSIYIVGADEEVHVTPSKWREPK